MTAQLRRPRIAYARALQQNGSDALKSFCENMTNDGRETSLKFDWSDAEPNIRDTDAMAMLSVTEGKADFALIPYINDAGYNFAALNDLGSTFELIATKIISADTLHCVAALTDDIVAHGQNNSGPNVSTIFVSRDAHALVKNELAGFSALGAQVSVMESAKSVSTALLKNGPEGGDRGAYHAGGETISGVRAAVMPQALAKDNSRFTILKHDVGAQPKRQWFLCVQRARDETVYFDKYKTTKARARYFCRRLTQIADASPGARGVGVILRFKRDGDAAATADIEAYLRAHGVRYDVMDLPPRDNKNAPPPRIMEIEFERPDFDFGLGRQKSGAVASGAMKIAFAKWKSRGVKLIGVMALSDFRLAKREPRRWWLEGAGAGVESFANTFFVRFSRLLIYALAVAALAGAFFMSPPGS